MGAIVAASAPHIRFASAPGTESTFSTPSQAPLSLSSSHSAVFSSAGPVPVLLDRQPQRFAALDHGTTRRRTNAYRSSFSRRSEPAILAFSGQRSFVVGLPNTSLEQNCGW